MLKNYWELIRWKNLFFLLVIQKLLEYSVVFPILQTYGFQTKNSLEYWLLNVATILITASGYVVNDYFDVKIDKINKPQKVLVGKKIDKIKVMNFYIILSVLGVGVGLLLAFLVKSLTLGLIFIFTVGLLWFYSSSYKRQFLIGNIIVSFASALSLFIVAILSIQILQNSYSVELLKSTPIPTQIYRWVGGFSLFSFLMTLVREIIKDMEDIQGDREQECRTMPIILGIKKAKTVVIALLLMIILLLFFTILYWIDFTESITFRYTISALIIPLLLTIFFVIKAQKSSDFHQISSILKIIMVLGIFYALIFNYLQAKTYNFPIWDLFFVK